MLQHLPFHRLNELGLMESNAPTDGDDLGVVRVGNIGQCHPPIENGLTTRWVYDDNLTDEEGLDENYSSYMPQLELGIDCDGRAVEMENPEGERSLSVFDGTGRSVLAIERKKS